MSEKATPKPNQICQSCTRKCKQPESVHILACPHFDAQAVQLEIKLPGLKKPGRKKQVKA